MFVVVAHKEEIKRKDSLEFGIAVLWHLWDDFSPGSHQVFSEFVLDILILLVLWRIFYDEHDVLSWDVFGFQTASEDILQDVKLSSVVSSNLVVPDVQEEHVGDTHRK